MVRQGKAVKIVAEYAEGEDRNGEEVAAVVWRVEYAGQEVSLVFWVVSVPGLLVSTQEPFGT